MKKLLTVLAAMFISLAATAQEINVYLRWDNIGAAAYEVETSTDLVNWSLVEETQKTFSYATVPATGFGFFRVIPLALPAVSETFDWTEVPEAAEYHIWSGTQSHTYDRYARAYSPPQTVFGFTEGVQYFYSVAAVNIFGTETWITDEATFTPPVPPLNLKITIGSYAKRRR